MLPKIIAIVTLIVMSTHYAMCMEREMTIQVNAKERECFYEKVPENFIIDLEYQVCLN